MANRRMFSKAITSSAKFLKMPPSTQTLYFHLGLNADDDGVVEGFNIMRMIGSTEDELKILVAKGYIIILNEDLVSYITDWKEHNLIRADRKVDSIYKELLLQVVNDVKLIEHRTRADLKPKEIALKEEKSCPMDVQLPTNGQHRLVKDRLDKVSLSKVKKDNIYTNIFNYYLSLNLIKHKQLTPAIKKAIDLAIKENKYTLDEMKELIDRHKAVTESTKNDGKYAIKVRELKTFFGQKIQGGTALICTQYEEGGKYYNLSQGGSNGGFKTNNNGEKETNGTTGKNTSSSNEEYDFSRFEV